MSANQFIVRGLFAPLLFLSGASYALDCKLKDVKFPKVTGEQALAIKSSGGACDDQERPTKAPAIRFGQKGFIVFEGKNTSYLDIASETALDIANKDIVLYGYVGWMVDETDPVKVVGYRFDFEMSEGGEYLKSSNVVLSGKPTINIVLTPDLNKPGRERENLSQMRKENFKILTQSKSQNALVKITGKTGAYSNTGGLYIKSEMIELIELGGKN
jgi:hypothetical protein